MSRGCPGGVGGEVALHHDRLLADECNVVCGGPGWEVVESELAGGVVKAGPVNGSGDGRVIHVFSTRKYEETILVPRATPQEAGNLTLHVHGLSERKSVSQGMRHSLMLVESAANEMIVV